ncbi:hypothetical protein KCU93_g186, partial [Aureobasidium melanogenum]
LPCFLAAANFSCHFLFPAVVVVDGLGAPAVASSACALWLWTNSIRFPPPVNLYNPCLKICLGSPYLWKGVFPGVHEDRCRVGAHPFYASRRWHRSDSLATRLPRQASCRQSLSVQALPG